jgi:hypothetical protein
MSGSRALTDESEIGIGSHHETRGTDRGASQFSKVGAFATDEAEIFAAYFGEPNYRTSQANQSAYTSGASA